MDLIREADDNDYQIGINDINENNIHLYSN